MELTKEIIDSVAEQLKRDIDMEGEPEIDYGDETIDVSMITDRGNLYDHIMLFQYEADSVEEMVKSIESDLFSFEKWEEEVIEDITNNAISDFESIGMWLLTINAFLQKYNG